MTDPHRAAYVDALAALARRELSEAQIRRHLGRRGHPEESIEAAADRLKAEGAIDDARVAEAIARRQIGLKGRGRMRVRLEVERAGIARGVAERVTNDAFRDIDADALLDSALDKRLHGRQQPADTTEARRLYRHLVGQGFEPERVMSALATRRRPR
jgi:SOS response regulatory protein OraA/RecX